MVWTDGGLQHSDGSGNLVFASHLNTKAMQERGNKVITGCGVTPQGPVDLTVQVEFGNVIANGIVVAVNAIDPFAGAPNTFATTQGALTSGQAQFVMIHVDSSGVTTNTEGTAAVSGQQLPPEVPEDECLIAMITLTFGDTTIDTVDIEDWRQFTPDGIALADDKEVIYGNDGDFHLKFNSTSGNWEITDGTNVLFSFVDSGTFGTLLGSAIDTSGKDIDINTGSLIVNDGADKTLTATELAFLDGLTENVQTHMSDVDGGIHGLGVISNTPALDQSLLTTSNVKFGNVELTGDIGVSGDTDLIQLASASVIINGSFEGTEFSSGINSQSTNPPIDAGFPPDRQWDDEVSNVWENVTTVDGSFNNPIIDISTKDLELLDITKYRLSVTNPSYTKAEITLVVDIEWYYSKDGGTTWTLVGTYQTPTGSSGTVSFDNTTIDFNGVDITGDVKVSLRVSYVSGTIGTGLDIATFQSSYGVAIRSGA